MEQIQKQTEAKATQVSFPSSLQISHITKASGWKPTNNWAGGEKEEELHCTPEAWVEDGNLKADEKVRH